MSGITVTPIPALPRRGGGGRELVPSPRLEEEGRELVSSPVEGEGEENWFPPPLRGRVREGGYVRVHTK